MNCRSENVQKLYTCACARHGHETAQSCWRSLTWLALLLRTPARSPAMATPLLRTTLLEG